MSKPKVSSDGRTITVRVPISIRRRGGRKLVLAPDGTEVTEASLRARVDSAMVKAIARAFRWREMLERGTHATIAEIAAAEKVNESYIARVVRLSLLAPDLIETILDGHQSDALTLAALMRPFPVVWKDQAAQISMTGDRTKSTCRGASKEREPASQTSHEFVLQARLSPCYDSPAIGEADGREVCNLVDRCDMEPGDGLHQNQRGLR